MSEKILVIQTAFLGDCILTLPMIQKLKEKYKNCTVDVVCIPSNEEIFANSPSVDNVILYDKRDKQKSIFSVYKFANELKEAKYTKIFSPHRSTRTSLMVHLSGVKDTTGFTNSEMSWIYKKLITYEPTHHEIQRNFDLIKFKYTKESWKVLPEVNLKEDDEVNSFLGDIDNNLIAIAPESIWKTKRYPIEYYIEIIDYLLKKKFKIVLIGGKEESKNIKYIADEFEDRILNGVGKFSLMQSINVLKKCRLLVTNDSAPSHLALCANTKTLMLYCSTVSDFGFYPYGEGSAYLSYDDLECKPCGVHGHTNCPIGTFDCGIKLKPEMVITQIERMLNDK